MTDDSTESNGGYPWSLLGGGGTVSRCCLVAAPAAGGAAVAAGGTTAALGGGLVRVLVSALTVGVIGVGLRYRRNGCSYEESEH